MQIRRAYRNLLTKKHPDKGGDATQFDSIKTAYDVLSDPEKVSSTLGARQATLSERIISIAKGVWQIVYFFLQKDVYDKTGKVQLSVEEQLRQNFGRGTAHLSS